MQLGYVFVGATPGPPPQSPFGRTPPRLLLIFLRAPPAAWPRVPGGPRAASTRRPTGAAGTLGSFRRSIRCGGRRSVCTSALRCRRPKTYPHPRIPAARLIFVFLFLFFVYVCFLCFSSTWGDPEVGDGDDFLGSCRWQRPVSESPRGNARDHRPPSASSAQHPATKKQDRP